ncbi:MAG: phenylacetate-CoA ligase [Parcubacteria group bacterium Gr01-1014_20]|nr:MAG: phenylacetate-CoA ligase [Parcubacteria group bacterium Gr01-1014_20]
MDHGRHILKNLDFNGKSHLRDFYAFDITKFEGLLKTKDESFWEKLGERKALKLFHLASKRVPAYRDFLKKHKVNPVKVKTSEDFKQVPLTDKKNYVNFYPIEKRSWDGEMAQAKLVAVSSGTSGEPKFWPRGHFQELEAAVVHELLYRYLFEINKYRTLLVVGFPMGVYVSGVATLLPSWLVSSKNYPLTLASVGNNKNEILRLVKNLDRDYEQIVLIGHPFFLKDVIETGKEEGIRWSSRRLRLMFCSEGFNETWRKYLASEAGLTSDLKNIINTYGSSELLLMAHETPLSILIRTLLEKNKHLNTQLFNKVHTPGLFQFNPYLRHIESVKGELIFTSASGLPLVRFNLKDGGKVVKFKEMSSALDDYEPKWRAELKASGGDKVLWKLPFVSLLGRSDHTIVFYAANIYPEHVHSALNHEPFLRKLTGKFTMRKDYRDNMDEFLEINIELKSRVKPTRTLALVIREHVIKRLKEVNMEYLFLWNNLDKDIRPRIKLWPYQHQKYFKPGLKPKYISRD